MLENGFNQKNKFWYEVGSKGKLSSIIKIDTQLFISDVAQKITEKS